MSTKIPDTGQTNIASVGPAGPTPTERMTRRRSAGTDTVVSTVFKDSEKSYVLKRIGTIAPVRSGEKNGGSSLLYPVFLLANRATGYFYCHRWHSLVLGTRVCHSLRKVIRNILASTFTAFLAIKSHSCCISNERCCFKNATVAMCRNGFYLRAAIIVISCSERTRDSTDGDGGNRNRWNLRFTDFQNITFGSQSVEQLVLQKSLPRYIPCIRDDWSSRNCSTRSRESY